ncbi:MAG: hypothetical protein WBF75_19385, partial [Pseudonocardiaceae bacterium]
MAERHINQALEELAVLVAPRGQEVLDRLARVEVTPETELRVGAVLRRDYPVEQASSEVIAEHRARRFAGAVRVADLCCGIGGDLLALGGQREV